MRQGLIRQTKAVKERYKGYLKPNSSRSTAKVSPRKYLWYYKPDENGEVRSDYPCMRYRLSYDLVDENGDLYPYHPDYPDYKLTNIHEAVSCSNFSSAMLDDCLPQHRTWAENYE